jgi:broad specificity phosphatase PhoE
MPHVFIITHPEVTFDAATPVSQWQLSELGQRRLESLAGLSWVPTLRSVHSSTEPKATATAQRIAGVCGVKVQTHANLVEIDRSATGVLPPARYSEVTEEFFARPDQSASGWERAVDAQRRMVDAAGSILIANSPDGDIAIVTHGGVATLLLCYHRPCPIRRSEDQPGQGHYLVFDRATMKPITAWLRFETDW